MCCKTVCSECKESINAYDRASVWGQAVSFVIAEHNANIALRHADQAYVLENGRVALSGTTAELLARSDVEDFYLGGVKGARLLAGV